MNDDDNDPIVIDFTSYEPEELQIDGVEMPFGVSPGSIISFDPSVMADGPVYILPFKDGKVAFCQVDGIIEMYPVQA